MIERRVYGTSNTRQLVEPGDLQRSMASTPPEDDPSFSWRDGRRGVAVVVSVVGDSHCQVAVLDGGRWHDLVTSGSDEQVWVSLAGVPGVVPRASVVPCRYGLDVLLAVTGAAGFDGMRAAYDWRPAPAWVDDRRGYLLRDVTEVLWDAAGELWLRIAMDGSGADTGAVGVRHLARLRGLHHRAVSDGLGAAVAGFPPDWFDAAVRAAEYFALHDLADLLRHVRAGGDGDDDYERLIDDAGAVRAALQRRIDAAPGEFGVADVPRQAGTDLLHPWTGPDLDDLDTADLSR